MHYMLRWLMASQLVTTHVTFIDEDYQVEIIELKNKNDTNGEWQKWGQINIFFWQQSINQLEHAWWTVVMG